MRFAQAPFMVVMLLAAGVAPGTLGGSEATVSVTMRASDGGTATWELDEAAARAYLDALRTRLGLDATTGAPVGVRGNGATVHAGDLRFEGAGPCTVHFLQATNATVAPPSAVPRPPHVHEGGTLDIETGRGRHWVAMGGFPGNELPGSFGTHDRFRAVGHGWYAEFRWRAGEADCIGWLDGAGYAHWNRLTEDVPPLPS